MSAILETYALKKTSGSGPTAIHALRPTGLCITAGEFVAMVGPSVIHMPANPGSGQHSHQGNP